MFNENDTFIIVWKNCNTQPSNYLTIVAPRVQAQTSWTGVASLDLLDGSGKKDVAPRVQA